GGAAALEAPQRSALDRGAGLCRGRLSPAAKPVPARSDHRLDRGYSRGGQSYPIGGLAQAFPLARLVLYGAPLDLSSMQTSLVTGGAGFIGSHLVEALLGTRRPGVVLGGLSTGSIGNLGKTL